MSDAAKRQELAQNAPMILDQFGLEQVMVRWKEAIVCAIEHRHPTVVIQAQTPLFSMFINK